MSSESDFADLKFKVECGQMVLTKAGENSFTLQGPGEIWQDRDGSLQFKIFATHPEYLKLIQYSWRGIAPGKVIPAEDYFSLEVVTHPGHQWKADRVLPSARGGFTAGLATGKLQKLEKLESYPGNDASASIRICFSGKLKFPLSRGTMIDNSIRTPSTARNVAVIDDGELHFELYHEDEHTVVKLKLPLEQYHDEIPHRIHEALQFVLGKQLSPLVIQTRLGEEGLTRLISPDRGKGSMPPPLKFNEPGSELDVWRMFTRYFRYISSKREAGRHPISRYIARAIESTAASFDMQNLALSVAVEGLAGECFSEIAPVESTLMEEIRQIKVMIKDADPLEISEDTKSRILGMVDAMRSPRNSDIIRAFIKQHHLSHGLFTSWKRLRNTSAHGGGGERRDLESTVKRHHEVLSLLYAMVLEKIGYAGPRSDYSAQGWQNAHWPVNQTASSKLVPPGDSIKSV